MPERGETRDTQTIINDAIRKASGNGVRFFGPTLIRHVNTPLGETVDSNLTNLPPETNLQK